MSDLGEWAKIISRGPVDQRDAELASLRSRLAEAERQQEDYAADLRRAQHDIDTRDKRTRAAESRAAIAERERDVAKADRDVAESRKSEAFLRMRGELTEARRQRDDLLARIHGDGGQHTGEVGVEQACREAHVIVATAFVERDEAHARYASCELALRLIWVRAQLRDPVLACAEIQKAAAEEVRHPQTALRHLFNQIATDLDTLAESEGDDAAGLMRAASLLRQRAKETA